MIPPAEAISRLKEGNGRFIARNPQHPHESNDERAYIAKNSYENAGTISLGMTSEEAAKRRAELARVSIRLRSFSVVPIRVCRPNSSLMKASEICSSFE